MISTGKYLAFGALGAVALWWLLRPAATKDYGGKKVPTTVDKPPLPPQALWQCPAPGTRVLLVGDSYADGLKPHLAALAQDCAVPFAAATQVGSSATKWATDAGLGALLASSTPTVVLVSLGGNDFQRDQASVQAAVTTLVGRLRNAGARVLWIAPLTLPFADKAGVRAMWKVVVGEDWLDGEKFEYPRATDKIHLYPSGYQDWAGKVWTWMSALTRGYRP